MFIVTFLTSIISNLMGSLFCKNLSIVQTLFFNLGRLGNETNKEKIRLILLTIINTVLFFYSKKISS